MDSEILTKAAYARKRGVDRAAVNVWLKRGVLSRECLTDDGKVIVAVAEQQLATRLDQTRSAIQIAAVARRRGSARTIKSKRTTARPRKARSKPVSSHPPVELSSSENRQTAEADLAPGSTALPESTAPVPESPKSANELLLEAKLQTALLENRKRQIAIDRELGLLVLADEVQQAVRRAVAEAVQDAEALIGSLSRWGLDRKAISEVRDAYRAARARQVTQLREEGV